MISKKVIKEAFFNFFQTLFILVSAFLIVYFFIGQLLEVTGNSMYPNFKDKEQLVAEKISIKSKGLKRGDIAILKHPFQKDKLLIKRVIGLPGEKIKIEGGYVFINGEKLEESYLPENTYTKGGKTLEEGFEYTIRDNSYVVMGDNRGESTDSREWGYVNKDLFVGKGVLIYYPISELRIIKGENY